MVELVKELFEVALKVLPGLAIKKENLNYLDWYYNCYGCYYKHDRKDREGFRHEGEIAVS